jgi:predicted nucleotidyltransferase
LGLWEVIGRLSPSGLFSGRPFVGGYLKPANPGRRGKSLSYEHLRHAVSTRLDNLPRRKREAREKDLVPQLPSGVPGLPESWQGLKGLEEDIQSRRIGESVMEIDERLGSRREDILRIAATHGAIRVRVFGSVARGDADENSDIDFLVDMEPGRTLFDLGGLPMDLRDLLGREVDVVAEPGLKARFRHRVVQEAIAL